MVIRGNSRSNPRQLSHYLLAQKDNEHIRILAVNGQIDAKAEDLHRSIFLMGVSSELSKSEKGLYHAQINPAIGEDALMDDNHWLQAADILGKQLNLEHQSRAIVLHTKKGRTHAHVVWERFDHDQQKMVSDSFSRLAQDRARKEMELVFGHKQTPHRNRHRPELKASLTQLWNQTGTGAQFVKAANENGYLIAEGSGRSPYMVVDENARSYDLTRQLKGVRLKEVRQRLRHESLMGEKDAVIKARNNADNNAQRDGKGKQKASSTLKYKTMQQEFSDNKGNITGQSDRSQQQAKDQFKENQTDTGTEAKPKENIKQQTDQNKFDATGKEKEKSVKDKFAENKEDATKTGKEQDKEKRREEFRRQMREINERNAKNRDKGLDMG